MTEQLTIGDEVTFCGVVIAISESGNPIVQLKGSGRFLIKKEDIKTIHPYDEPPKEDKRRGR